jgi:hypothetical protein
MSFEDIGARLGMTKQRVYDEYQRALNKRRQSPEAAQWFAVVVAQQSGYSLCLLRRRNRGCA